MKYVVLIVILIIISIGVIIIVNNASEKENIKDYASDMKDIIDDKSHNQNDSEVEDHDRSEASDNVCVDVNSKSIGPEEEDNRQEEASSDNFGKDDSIILSEPGGCGDGVCSEGDSCCLDCGCEEGFLCSIDNECLPESEAINLSYDPVIAKYKVNSVCGDGYCNDEGLQIGDENSSNCCVDCGCELGICENNKCGIKIMPLAEMKMKASLFDELGYDRYLLVTIDQISLTKRRYDGKKCSNYGTSCTEDRMGEFALFTRAAYGEDKQEVIYPMGRPSSVSTDRDIPAKFVDGPIPIFTENYEYLDDSLDLVMMLTESDTATKLPRINSDNSDTTISSVFYNGNENLGEITKKLTKPYSLGQYTDYLPWAIIKYRVDEVKKVNNLRVKVTMNSVYGIDDGDVGYNNKGELVYWYRVSTGILADEFGDSYQYDSVQKAGGSILGKENDPYTFPLNEVIYEGDMGPFLYVEAQIIDLDSDCKSMQDIPFPCSDTDKVDVIGTPSIFLKADDDWLLSNPDKTIVKTFTDSNNFAGFKVTIEREPLIQND